MGYHQSNSGVKRLKYFFFKNNGNNDDNDVANDDKMALLSKLYTKWDFVLFFCFLVSLKGDISGEKKRIVCTERVGIVLDSQKTLKDVSKPDRHKWQMEEIGRGA